MTAMIPSIEPWAEQLAASLWRASWQGGVALAIAWAIARWCTFLSPRVVCWVWRLACLKLLVALIWIEPVSLALLPARKAVVARSEIAGVASPSSEITHDLPPVREVAPTALQPQQIQAALGFWSLLMFLWLVGATYRAAVNARQWSSISRLLRSASPAPSLQLQGWYQQEAQRLKIRRRPRLLISSQADGPLLAGIWRQVVVLPDRADEAFDESELRLMLAHELAHFKRHDLAWNWLPTLVGWLFYFHPLAWLMRRQWSESQEAACDEMLIQRRVAQPADYGRLLLKVATHWPCEPCWALVAPGVLGAYRNLERRIQRMAHVKPFSFVRLIAAATILLLVAVPATVPWQLAAQETSGLKSVAGQAHREATFAIQTGQGGEASIQESATAPIPGKLYAQAILEFTTAANAMEKYSGVIAIDPNTGTWEKVGEFGNRFQVSPDGTRFLYCTSRHVPNAPTTHISDIWVVDAKGATPVRIDEEAICPHWSPDGKQVLYFKGKRSEGAGWRGPTFVFDLETKQAKKLPVPETDEVDDWSREGNWLVTVSARHRPDGSGYQLYIMHPDGTGERRLTEGALNCYPNFSRDGKRIVYNRSQPGVNTLWVVDVDGSNRKQVMSENKEGGVPDGACWSPDGKWLAVKVFDWQTRTGDDGKQEKVHTIGESNEHIELLAPDGTNRRTIKLAGVTKMIWIETPSWH